MKYVAELFNALALVRSEMNFKGLKSFKAKDVMQNITKIGNHYYYKSDSFKVPFVKIYKDGSYKVVLSVRYSTTINGRRCFAENYTKESIIKELENGFNTVKVRGGFITVKGKRVDITA